MPIDAGLGLLLGLTIVFVIFATAVARMHPFLVLLAASYAVALAAGLPAVTAVTTITQAFGATLQSIGIVIAAGAIIGTCLERGGGARRMAGTITRWSLRLRAAPAASMSVTGAVVSVPVFCDAGFIVLAPLCRALAVASRASMATFAVTLSLGLYTTHVLVPPTPGPFAAAGQLGADVGLVILLGLIVTVPVLTTTYVFASWMGGRIFIDPARAAGPPAPLDDGTPDAEPDQDQQPSTWAAFSPVVLPVALIACRSLMQSPGTPFGAGALPIVLGVLGEPNTALLIGAALALVLSGVPRARQTAWVTAALRGAGPIVLITGAGGALGGVLRAAAGSPDAASLASAPGSAVMGLVLAWVIAATFKTALGSSTVAMITTASLVAPTLAGAGLGAGAGPALATLAIGAGSMVVSHANDSYFWVVTQLSGMSVAEGYLLHTLGSAVAGASALLGVLALSLVL